jgi:hypothetical protein
VRFRLSIAIVLLLAATGPAAGQGAPAADLSRAVDNLANFDYPTRTTAARQLRRAPASSVVPILAGAARGHADEFVRYRALVVLTSFNDRGTPDLMRTLLADRNDRVREVAYRWFERYPDPALTMPLLAALNTEQSEFVRPVLVRAIAALPGNDVVQRALVAEIGRGFDFFRSAVIEALGDYRATYAIEAVSAIATEDGSLQDDAVLALGRMGDRRAVAPLSTLSKTPPDVAASLQAAQCMLGDACTARIEWLVTTARSSSRPEAVRAAVASLGAIARQNQADARSALMTLAQDGSDRLSHEAALALSGVALRQPAQILGWLLATPDDGVRTRAIELLQEGFESLEEDFAEEQFFAAARAAYWMEPEGSPRRTVLATVIDMLEF